MTTRSNQIAPDQIMRTVNGFNDRHIYPILTPFSGVMSNEMVGSTRNAIQHAMQSLMYATNVGSGVTEDRVAAMKIANVPDWTLANTANSSYARIANIIRNPRRTA